MYILIQVHVRRECHDNSCCYNARSWMCTLYCVFCDGGWGVLVTPHMYYYYYVQYMCTCTCNTLLVTFCGFFCATFTWMYMYVHVHVLCSGSHMPFKDIIWSASAGIIIRGGGTIGTIQPLWQGLAYESWNTQHNLSLCIFLPTRMTFARSTAVHVDRKFVFIEVFAR